MDDLKLIRETLTATPPTPRATAEARRRVTAAIDEFDAPRRSSWWSAPWSFATAGALAIVVVVALAAGSLGGRPKPTEPPLGQGSEQPARPGEASARGILLAAATRAATDSGAGRYWHVRIVASSGPIVVGTKPNEYAIVDRTVNETWIARDPADPSYAGRRSLGSRPRSAADEQKWRAAGSPTQWTIDADNTAGQVARRTTPDQGELSRIQPSQMYLVDLGGFEKAQVDALPTDPAALRDLFTQRIAGRPSAPTDERGIDAALFAVMCQLLVDVPAEPHVRAAALTVLAGIPGIRLTGQVKDDEGRVGTGIELPDGGDDVTDVHQLIVDPATHLLLASNYVATSRRAGAEFPVKQSHQVILHVGWSDQPPVVPSIP